MEWQDVTLILGLVLLTSLASWIGEPAPRILIEADGPATVETPSEIRHYPNGCTLREHGEGSRWFCGRDVFDPMLVDVTIHGATAP